MHCESKHQFELACYVLDYVVTEWATFLVPCASLRLLRNRFPFSCASIPMHHETVQSWAYMPSFFSFLVVFLIELAVFLASVCRHQSSDECLGLH